MSQINKQKKRTTRKKFCNISQFLHKEEHILGKTVWKNESEIFGKLSVQRCIVKFQAIMKSG